MIVPGRILGAMAPNSAPAGWYDDPAGTGGRRYWDGHTWTDRTQGAGTTRPSTVMPSSASRDRLPDGYMMLNGHRVPLGQTLLPSSRPNNRGLVVAALIALGLMAAIVAASAFLSSSDGSDEVPVGETEVMIEVETRHGSTIDVRWGDPYSSRQEETVDSGWSLVTDAGEGSVSVNARPTDYEDYVTCRITDAQGEVLVEESSTLSGFGVDCRVDR